MSNPSSSRTSGTRTPQQRTPPSLLHQELVLSGLHAHSTPHTDPSDLQLPPPSLGSEDRRLRVTNLNQQDLDEGVLGPARSHPPVGSQLVWIPGVHRRASHGHINTEPPPAPALPPSPSPPLPAFPLLHNPIEPLTQRGHLFAGSLNSSTGSSQRSRTSSFGLQRALNDNLEDVPFLLMDDPEELLHGPQMWSDWNRLWQQIPFSCPHCSTDSHTPPTSSASNCSLPPRPFSGPYSPPLHIPSENRHRAQHHVGSLTGTPDLHTATIPTSALHSFVSNRGGLSPLCFSCLRRFHFDASLAAQHKSHELCDCSICLDLVVSGDDCIELPCGHLFHNPCIRDCFRSAHRCPNCRTDLMPTPQS